MVIAKKPNPRPIDSTYVDVHHEEPLVYWLDRFRVSQLMLRQTVRLVGPRFKDVSTFLSTRRNPDRHSSNLR